MTKKFSIKKLVAGVMAAAMVVTALPVSGLAAKAAESDTTPVYVLYDANRGEHYLTADASEKDGLLSIGWKEGNVAWTSPKSSKTPVYCLYNPNNGGDHYYTANASEKDGLLAAGWTEGNVKFYSDDEKGVLINTLYNPNEVARNHHYTASLEETNGLVTLGWQNHTDAATAIYGVATAKISVKLSNTAPKVGDTVSAVLSDGAESKIASYKWELLEAASSAEGDSIGNGTSVAVIAGMVNKYIRVTVVDKDGNKYSSDAALVTTDNTAEATIVDVNGFQADGTALAGDTLSITYGSDMGTPKNVTWYANDLVALSSDFTGAAANLSLTTSKAAKADLVLPEGSAVVYAIITTTDGKQIRTKNTVTVTAVADAITVSGFEFLNDYDTPKLSYNPVDADSLVKVTMSKAVAGDLYIYKDTVSKYGNANNFATITAEDFGRAAQVTDINDLTAKKAVAKAAGAGTVTGIYYNNSNGSRTYIIKVADADMDTVFSPVRGTKYKAVFDQDSITDDDIGDTTRSDVKVVEGAVAPYIKAPAKIALTKHTGGLAPTITLYGDDDKVLTWMGVKAGTDDADDVGVASFITYDEKGGSKAQANRVKHNETTATAKQGTIEGTLTLGSSATYGYYWAAIKTAKGVFGEKAIELESDIVAGAEAPYATMNLVDKKDTPTTAVVTFSKLKSAGVVYIVEGSDGKSTAVDIAKTLDPDDPSTYTAKKEVAKSATKVEIPGAIQTYEESIAYDATDGTKYLAVFAPADEDYDVAFATTFNNTGFSVDDSDVSSALTLSQVPTSLEYDKNTAGTLSKNATATLEISGTTLLAYDQFGDLMQTTVEAKNVDSVTVKDTDLTSTERGTATYSVNGANGQATVALTMAANTDKGDGYEIKVLGSTLKVTNLYDNTPYNGNATQANSNKALKVTFGDDTLFVPAARVITAAPIASAQSVLAVAFDTGAEDQDGFEFDMSGLNGKHVTVNGITATISDGKADGTFKVTFAGSFAEDRANDTTDDFEFTVGEKTLKFTLTYNGAHSTEDELAAGDYDACVATII